MSAGAAKANHLCPRLCSSIYAFTENRKPLVQALKRPEAGRRRGASRRLKAPSAGGGRGIAPRIGRGRKSHRHSRSDEPVSRFDSAPTLLYKVPVGSASTGRCRQSLPLADGLLPGLMPGLLPESGQRQPARAHPPCCESSTRHCAPVLPAAPAPPHAPQPPHPGTSRSQPCSAFPFPNGTPAAT